MTEYRLVAEPKLDPDVEAAFDWHESQQSQLGLRFLTELRATYGRLLQGPFKYQELQSGIRRALPRSQVGAPSVF